MPGPPANRLAEAFPVRVSARLPPVMFSRAVAEVRVSVRFALTIWAVVSPRFRAIAWPVVEDKSSVSIPALSLTVSIPNAASASKRYVSFPAPPTCESVPAPPVMTSLPPPPVRVSLPSSPYSQALRVMVVATETLSLPAWPRTTIRPVGANDPTKTVLIVTVVFEPERARAIVSFAVVPPTNRSVLVGSSSLVCRLAATIETLLVVVEVAPSSSVRVTVIV